MVLEMVGGRVTVNVFVGVPVQVEVRLVVEVNVSVNVGVKVRVAEAEGVYVTVFSTGWKGVRVTGNRMRGTEYGIGSPVLVGMNAKMDARSVGITHPTNSKQLAKKVNKYRLFIE